MPEWATTLIVALFAALAAWFTARVTARTSEYSRIKDLESRVDLVEKRNVLLWNYNRLLIDHIYEGKQPPPPPMPEGII